MQASWSIMDWNHLREYVNESSSFDGMHFDVEVGRILLALIDQQEAESKALCDKIRKSIATSLSHNEASSMQNCHDLMLKFHALTEIELIQSAARSANADSKTTVMNCLDRRLAIIGPFLSDKQYLLGLRRATMQCFKYVESRN